MRGGRRRERPVVRARGRRAATRNRRDRGRTDLDHIGRTRREEEEISRRFVRGCGSLHDGLVVRPQLGKIIERGRNFANGAGRWEADAESKCETLVTEALLVAPLSPEPLQTLASVRISQLRLPDAKAALARSMELWNDLPPEDPHVPDFPTRISLARLLMEAEMEMQAIEVLERLVQEDDGSVEAWYLGGWCLFLMGEKRRKAGRGGENKGMEGGTELDGEGEDWMALMAASREWLRNSLKLYDSQDYEDDRLRDHALELVGGLDAELGDAGADEEEDGGGEWEDEEGDGDEEESDEDGGDLKMNGT